MDRKELSEHIEQLRSRDPKIAVTFNQEGSAIAILRGKLSDPVNVTELSKSPHDIARRFVRDHRKFLGDIDETKELVDERAITNPRGITHVVFHQKHGGALSGRQEA